MYECNSGESQAVVTASRVPFPIGQRYSTCEQELLAVVHALHKYRTYIFGNHVAVFSDN
jgi:hypothetical protein